MKIKYILGKDEYKFYDVKISSIAFIVDGESMEVDNGLLIEVPEELREIANSAVLQVLLERENSFREVIENE